MGERLTGPRPKPDRSIRHHRYCNERVKELGLVHRHHHEWSIHRRLAPDLVPLRRRLRSSRLPLEQALDRVKNRCRGRPRLSVLVPVMAIRYVPWKELALEKD